MKERPIIFSAPMVRAILDGRKTQTRRVVKPQPVGGDRIERDGSGWVVGRMRDSENAWRPLPCPFGQPGDGLWVRETWSGLHVFRNTAPLERKSFVGDGYPYMREDVWYWADGEPEYGDWERPRPSIHMPRWASRLTLEITGVRVERLQEISEADAEAEGFAAIPAQRWWHGYRDVDGKQLHQQFEGEVPPDWMIEPKPLHVGGEQILYPSAASQFRDLWDSLNAKRGFGWESNPWVWAVSFRRVET